jgi:hypothetical protein
LLGLRPFSEIVSTRKSKQETIQKPEEIVHLAKLTDAQIVEIGSLLKRGWTFAATLREVIEQLTPDDEIRALHTRAVANGEKWYLSSVGNFGHVVVWGTEKDKTLALSPRLKRLWPGHPFRNDLNATWRWTCSDLPAVYGAFLAVSPPRVSQK